MQAVGYAVSEAGIRAPLYWYHDAGYFEEFLGHKKGEGHGGYIFCLICTLRFMGSFNWSSS